MKQVIWTGVALLVLAGGARAEEAKAPAPVQTADATEKKICKNIVQTGSRLASHKECATASEWERMRSENKQTLDRQQREVGIKY